MTRVDFYVLSSADPQQRRLLACRLAEKAWRQGMRIYIHTSSEAETGIMDDLLWTFRQGSFIPHERETTPAKDREDVGVVIGHGAPPGDIQDLLINLAAATPLGFERFKRLAELVDEDEGVRQEGRRRYRFYKGQGHAIETHRMEPSG